MKTKPSVRELSPITDAQASAMVSTQARHELAESIMLAAPGAERDTATARRRWPRRLLIGASLAAGFVAAGFVALPSGEPGQKAGPVHVGPPTAEAAVLSFKEQGDYIVVKIKDPVADPKRYKKEFAAHGLNIDLMMVPSSPTLVGTFDLIEGSSKIKEITEKGRCEPASGGDDCTVGLKIPVNYRGHAQISIGRAARPGEKYDTTPQADAPGEALHGMKYRNRTVRDVLAMLRKRNITVPEYRYEGPDASNNPYEDGIPADKVKQDWYVHDAVLWAKGQVMLFVWPKPR